MRIKKKKIWILLVAALVIVATVGIGVKVNSNRAYAMVWTDTSTGLVWRYTVGSEMNSPARDVYLLGDDYEDCIITTDVIVPATFTDKYGTHDVTTVGKGGLANDEDSFFMGATLSRYVALVDLTNCKKLTTINKYSFYEKSFLTIKLPNNIKIIDENCFYGAQNTAVFCNNPNIKINGQDNTASTFKWVGPTKSTPRNFYGGNKYSNYNDDRAGNIVSCNATTVRLNLDKNDGEGVGKASYPSDALMNEDGTQYLYTINNDSTLLDVSKVTLPIRDHYTFEGYFTADDVQIFDENGEVVFDNVKALTDGTTVYAKWTPITYNITYSYEDRQIVQPVIYGNTFKVKGALFEKTANEFLGWTKTEGETTVAYAPNQNSETLLGENMTLYPAWKENRYSLLYNLNGGAGLVSNLYSIKYSDEYKVNDITAIYRTGYTFKQWNTKVDGSGKSYAPNEKITKLSEEDNSSITLYAIWTPNAYNIQFVVNSKMSQAVAGIVTEYDEIVTLPASTMTVSGYRFVEWNTKADGSGNSFKANTDVKNVGESGTAVIYAIYAMNQYTIEYSANDGIGENKYQRNIGYTDEFNLESSDGMRKTGYTFKEWNTKADGTGQSFKESGSVTMLSATHNDTMKLYAIWEPNTYEIKLLSNVDAIPSMDDATITYDEKTKLPKCTITRTGYTFVGWSTNSDAVTAQYEDEQCVLNLATSGTVTLYAVWTNNKYNIHYDGNGAESGSVNDDVVTYENSVLIANNGFVKKGYRFKGWSTTPTSDVKANEEESKADEKVVFNPSLPVLNLTSENNATVTLYAVWYQETYNISYDENSEGDNVSNSAEYKMTYHYEDTFELPTVTRTGYHFDGWYNTAKGQYVSEIKNQTGDIRLKAIWTKQSYAIQASGFNSEEDLYVNDIKITEDTKFLYHETINDIKVKVDSVYNLSKIIIADVNGDIYKTIKGTDCTLSSGNVYSATLDSAIMQVPEGGLVITIVKNGAVYTITYDENGGAINDTDYDTAYTYGAGTNKLPKNVTRTGMVFKGWRNKKDETVYENIAKEAYGDYNFVAKWEAATYPLSIDTKGGTIDDSSYVVKTSYSYNEGDILLPTKVTKEGYSFAGWYNDKSKTVVTRIDTKMEEEQSVYAIWNANESTSDIATIAEYTGKATTVSMATDIFNDTSNFYFNELTDIEKKLYTTMYNFYKFDMNTGKPETRTMKIESSEEWTIANVYNAGEALLRAYPELFWIRYFSPSEIRSDGGIDYYGEVHPVFAYNEVSFTADASEYKANFESAIAELGAGNFDSLSVSNKVKKIHDYIVTHYSYRSNSNILNACTTNETRAVGYMMSHKEGCCESYSKMVKILCNYYGIPCTIVTSDNHMWNEIQIDGTWYLLDVTWDDEGSTVSYGYFLKGSNSVADEDHTIRLSNFFNPITMEKILDYACLNVPEICKEDYKEPSSENNEKGTPTAVPTTAPPNTINTTNTNKSSTTTSAIKGKVQYKISGKNATVYKANLKKIASVTIGASIKIGGKTYKVTSIRKKAFKGCKKLRKITIRSTKLTIIGANAFKGIHKKAKFYTPKTQYKKYKKAAE